MAGEMREVSHFMAGAAIGDGALPRHLDPDSGAVRRAWTSWRSCSPPSTARSSRTPKGDIQRGLEVIEFACGMPHLLKGEHTAKNGAQAEAAMRDMTLATDTGQAVVDRTLQLHGGYGYPMDIRSSGSGATCASTASWKAPTR